HVGALEHLVPVPQDEVDVLVALRYEDCPLGVCKASQAGEHPAGAFLLGAAGHDAAIAQIAGAEAELVRAERAAEDRNPGSPEAASEGEPGREQPEDEDGAMRTLIAGACHGGHYAGLGSAGYVTPPGGSSQRVRRFQRATSHPSRRCTRVQTLFSVRREPSAQYVTVREVREEVPAVAEPATNRRDATVRTSEPRIAEAYSGLGEGTWRP